MILYKYFNKEDGGQFFKDPLIKFTPPKYFNDPFEVTGTYPIPTDVPNLLDRKKYTDEIYRTYYNVLSLTRSPLNRLMWAHYANEHKGYVIGIDVDHSVFTNVKTCTIPVQFGSVIYTDTKPNSLLLNSFPDSAFSYDFQEFTFKNAEMLQRLFLYKSIDWAYEEEVRVVKMLGNIGLHPGEDHDSLKELDEHFEVLEMNGSTWHKLKLSTELVKEIYFGVENDYSEYDFVKRKFANSKIYKCETDGFTWDLIGRPY